MSVILVGQSGGPTAVINASLYGVIRQGTEQGDTIWGMIHGIEGFMSGNLVNLTEYSKNNDISLLKNTPASFLGSCRYRLPEDLHDPVYREIFSKMQGMGIDTFLYIGGNDSMDTVAKLSSYAAVIHSPIRCIGIPKTIDNDLVMTDHTPGFGSTAKYVAATVREIAWDAGVYAHPVVTIVELMGRNAGWVTASSVLARTEYEHNPVLIYLPEINLSIEDFLHDVREALKVRNSVVVCVSEGIKDHHGRFFCEYGSESTEDRFGHKMLAGCGKILEGYVKREIGCKCRSIELNLPQRCSGIVASATDTMEAEKAGRFAVEQAKRGQTGVMVAFHREEGEYRLTYQLVPVAEVCNREKKFPLEWIVDGHDIAKPYLDYVMPLIQGENSVPYENGVPKLLKPVYYE